MAEIGLVTVLFNSNDVLDGFLKSLSIQTFANYHLFLIDNTPGNETDELLNKLFEKYNNINYTHIKNEVNEGIAKGNNQGIILSANLGTNYTLLLNNDIEFYQKDLLKKIHNCALEKNESLIIPKIFYYGTNQIWMAGGKLFEYSGKTIHIGDHSENDPAYNKAANFTYAPTCFMLINNDVFKKVGLMDESYFVYYDDTDFIYRAVNKGYKIFYMPDLEVMHKVSSSTGGSESLFTIYYTNRNRVYFLRKNFKGVKKLLPLVYTLVTRVGKSLVYDKKQRESMWKAVFAGFKMKN